MTDLARIVVCGGGAGGLELAVGLCRSRKVAVTLIDPSPTHLWKPLLHEAASGSLDVASHEVSYLALAQWRGFVFAHGPLTAIDRKAKAVSIGAIHDEDGEQIIPDRQIPYDILVLSVGGVTNSFGVAGVPENAHVLDTVADAERIQKHILRTCMRANFLETASAPLDVAIVGGGATGVELAAELRSTTRTLLAYGLKRLESDQFLRLTVVNADARLLQQLPERTSEAVTRVLAQLKVQIRNGEQVIRIEPGALITKRGERIPAGMIIWAAGVKAPSWLRERTDLKTNRLDQVIVSETLQTVSDPSIFALGDCAEAPWARHGSVPPRAQAAHQQAHFLTKSIPKYIAGRPLPAFRYNDLGSLLSLGERGGVGSLMGFVRGAGFEIEGFIASVLYRFLYKRHLASLFGWWTVALTSLGDWIGSSTRPKVKLH